MAEQAMAACLGRLGFNVETIAYLRSHGIATAQDFRAISLSTMDDFISLISKPGAIAGAMAAMPVPAPAAARAGRPNAAAAAAAAVVGQQGAQAPGAPPPAVMLPYLALTGLKALRAWIDFRIGRNEALNPDLFTEDVKIVWMHRVDFLKNAKLVPPSSVTPVPKLSKLENWTIWEQQFMVYLAQFRSQACFAPLTYAVRPNSVPTAEEMDAPYDDIDEALVATLRHEGADYRKDISRIWEIIKPLTLEGDSYHFIIGLNARQDGRQAFLNLKEQAEGPAAQEKRKSLAYQRLQTKYSGYSRRFTFDDYIALYQKSFNELSFLEEPVPNTKKVTDFLGNITDPSFNMIKTCVYGTPGLRDDFSQMQQYAKQLYDQHLLENVGKRGVAAVASVKRFNPVATKGPTPKKRKKQKQNKGDGHYEYDEWMKLTPAQKAEITRNREAKKKAARPAGITNPPRNANVSAIHAVPMETVHVSPLGPAPMQIDVKSVVSFDAPVKEVAPAPVPWTMRDVLRAPDLVEKRDHYRIPKHKTPREANEVARMMLYQTFDVLAHAPFCTDYEGRTKEEIQVFENVWNAYKFKIEAWRKRRVVWDNTPKSAKSELGDVGPPERVKPIRHYLSEELLKIGVTLTANMFNYHAPEWAEPQVDSLGRRKPVGRTRSIANAQVEQAFIDVEEERKTLPRGLKSFVARVKIPKKPPKEPKFNDNGKPIEVDSDESDSDEEESEKDQKTPKRLST
jgi:hypothetical protein